MATQSHRRVSINNTALSNINSDNVTNIQVAANELHEIY